MFIQKVGRQFDFIFHRENSEGCAPPLSGRLLSFLCKGGSPLPPLPYDLMGWKIIMMKSQLAQPSRVTEPELTIPQPPSPRSKGVVLDRPGFDPLRNFLRRVLSFPEEARVQWNYGVFHFRQRYAGNRGSCFIVWTGKGCVIFSLISFIYVRVFIVCYIFSFFCFDYFYYNFWRVFLKESLFSHISY